LSVRGGAGMAAVRFGGLVAEARGVCGDVVYSRNRAGAFARSRYEWTQPGSEWAVMARNRMYSLGYSWTHTLQEQHRAAWEAWAAVHLVTNVFGHGVRLCGAAAYAQVNFRRGVCGVGPRDWPPESWVAADLGEVTWFNGYDMGVWKTWVGATCEWPEFTGFYIYGTAPLGPVRRPYRTDFRLIQWYRTGFFLPGENIRPYLVDRFRDAAWSLTSRFGLLVCWINVETGALGVPRLLMVTGEIT